jgi:hypothetical protein
VGPFPKLANEKPGIVVVDNFLSNPEQHREHALSLEYEKKGSYGVRSKVPNPSIVYKSAFERILQRRIVNWDSAVNGCYQWCNREQDIVYHIDAQTYAAVLYLTPGAALNSGTSFWKSKHSGLSEIGREPVASTFGPAGEYLKDPDQWDLVDQVANVYNRLVIWYAKKIHSATSYFGSDIHDSRLFQIFFFDCE